LMSDERRLMIGGELMACVSPRGWMNRPRQRPTATTLARIGIARRAMRDAQVDAIALAPLRNWRLRVREKMRK